MNIWNRIKAYFSTTNWELATVNKVRAYTEVKVNGKVLSDVEQISIGYRRVKGFKKGKIILTKEIAWSAEPLEIVIRQKLQGDIITTVIKDVVIYRGISKTYDFNFRVCYKKMD